MEKTLTAPGFQPILTEGEAIVTAFDAAALSIIVHNLIDNT